MDGDDRESSMGHAGTAQDDRPATAPRRADMAPVDGPARRKRAVIAVRLLAVTLFAQQLALGADYPFLAVGFAAVLLAVAIATYLLVPPAPRYWRRAAPVTILLAITGIWLTLPTVLPGWLPFRTARIVAPDLAATGIATGLGVVAALFAASWIGHRRGGIRPLIDSLLFLGVIQIGLSLVLRGFDPEHVWGLSKGILTHRFTGTFLNANASGCLFGVVAILGAGRFLGLLREQTTTLDEARHVTRQALAALACVGGLGACALTESRTALFVTVLVLAWLAWSDRFLRLTLRRRGPRILAIVALFAGGAIVLWYGATTLDRFSTSGTDAFARYAIWQHYWALAMQAPWSGYGFYALDELVLGSIADRETAGALLYIHSPHNVLLSLLLVGGWPYALLAGAGVMWMMVAIVRSGRASHQDSAVRAILGSLLLIGLCASIDVALDIPAIACLAATLLGLAWGRALSRGSTARA